MKILKIYNLIFFLGVFLTGCSTLVSPPPDAEFSGSMVSEASEISPMTGWASVLQNSVDGQGRIDFWEVGSKPDAFHVFIRYIAQVSPQIRPEMFLKPEDKLAYYINAYNALALYGVIQKNIPTDFDGLTHRAKFFLLTKYVVGGERISLQNLENEVIRPLGDPRIHFALNCMVKSCPRLPQEVFMAVTLDQQLDDATREFINSPKHVQVNIEKKEVRLSSILKWYKDDFVNPQQASSLIKYINRYRQERIPESYEVEFLEYDWTVNKQSINN
ncbi:MAG: DUF547 domain-containing protein [Nitrospinales bacterium]